VQLFADLVKFPLLARLSPVYTSAMAVLVVYNTHERSTFDLVSSTVEAIRSTHQSTIIVLVGQITGQIDQREVSYLEGAELAGHLGVSFLETAETEVIYSQKALEWTFTLLGISIGISARSGLYWLDYFYCPSLNQ